jgi:hypothetical protein
MARELVTQKGVGERADNVWRQLQRQSTTVVTAVETPQPVLASDIALPAIAPPLPPCPPAPLALADFASSAIEDQQLMPEQRGFGSHGTESPPALPAGPW